MATELGKTETLMVTINSVDGFEGDVAITPVVMNGTMAVADWTLTATPPSVTLTAGGSQTVELTVGVPTNAADLGPTVNVNLSSSAEAAQVSSMFTVANQLTIEIPAGTGSGAHTGLPAPNAPIHIRAGAKLIFHNADITTHVIHGDGMQHEDLNGGQPNGNYMVTVNQTATWYCHDHEGPGNARPVVVE